LGVSITFMGYDKQTLQLFNSESINEERSLLVLGFEESLTKTLPKNSVIIEPNIATTKYACSKFQDKSFFTKDLTAFSLQKKFHNILSLNKLQFSKNLAETFLAIEKHLLEDAYIYFPLSCNKKIKDFLTEKTDDEEPFKDAPFKWRTRTNIEDAVMQAPFESIHIEEKTEHIDFYSIDALEKHLEKELPLLYPSIGDNLKDYTKELALHLYGTQNKDEVFSLSTPWILLSLSN
jgi:hypothetical protein